MSFQSGTPVLNIIQSQLPSLASHSKVVILTLPTLVLTISKVICLHNLLSKLVMRVHYYLRLYNPSKKVVIGLGRCHLLQAWLEFIQAESLSFGAMSSLIGA